jgi:PHP family Zn ribbon phosphoesterase
MKEYLTDLHVHTVLSPCGNLSMSPVNIINEAKKKGIHVLGITDHISTLHVPLMCELGKKHNIFVLPGCEVNTAEEVHCLTFFENIEICKRFQEFIESKLPSINNRPEFFGHQVVVNEQEEILEHVEPLLISALQAGINEVAEKVRELNGIFIPAHIERRSNAFCTNWVLFPMTFNTTPWKYRIEAILPIIDCKIPI